MVTTNCPDFAELHFIAVEDSPPLGYNPVLLRNEAPERWTLKDFDFVADVMFGRGEMMVPVSISLPGATSSFAPADAVCIFCRSRSSKA
jgi:hypothetical protein